MAFDPGAHGGCSAFLILSPTSNLPRSFAAPCYQGGATYSFVPHRPHACEEPPARAAQGPGNRIYGGVYQTVIRRKQTAIGFARRHLGRVQSPTDAHTTLNLPVPNGCYPSPASAPHSLSRRSPYAAGKDLRYLRVTADRQHLGCQN